MPNYIKAATEWWRPGKPRIKGPEKITRLEIRLDFNTLARNRYDFVSRFGHKVYCEILAHSNKNEVVEIKHCRGCRITCSGKLQFVNVKSLAKKSFCFKIGSRLAFKIIREKRSREIVKKKYKRLPKPKRVRLIQIQGVDYGKFTPMGGNDVQPLRPADLLSPTESRILEYALFWRKTLYVERKRRITNEHILRDTLRILNLKVAHHEADALLKGMPHGAYDYT